MTTWSRSRTSSGKCCSAHPTWEDSKLDAAADRLTRLNPNVTVVPHPARLTRDNALDLVSGYDIVIDGSDNFPTRYLVNDACVSLGKPDVYGSIHRFEGQASVFGLENGPCYRCLYPEPPPPGLVLSCARAGVLGVVPGIIGAIQAVETIKIIIGRGDALTGRLLLFDALKMEFREMQVPQGPRLPRVRTGEFVARASRLRGVLRRASGGGAVRAPDHAPRAEGPYRRRRRRARHRRPRAARDP